MENEIDIKEFMLALWRKKVIIVVITIVFLVIGLLLYGGINKNTSNKAVSSDKYEYVETDFLLKRGVEINYQGIRSTHRIAVDENLLQNLNSFVKSENFLNSILAELKIDEKANEYKGNITISSNKDGDIVKLYVAAKDEKTAKEISNLVLTEIEEKTGELYESQGIIVIDGPNKIDKESLNKELSTGGSKKKVILITVIGFVLACGYVIVVELFDSSVKGDEQLEKATKVKTLVRIPKANRDINEKFEVLRVRLNDYKTMLITSAGNREGKSFVASHLAKSYETSGKRALLTSVEELIKENPEEKIKELENNYDVVIIDSENALENANTLAIARLVKNTIVVCLERKTKLEKVVKTKDSIEDIGGKVIGNILNKSI